MLPYRPAGQSAGSDALAAQKLPRLHGFGCEAPPAHQLPAGHATQMSRVMLMKVPASHAAGLCTVLPSGHLKPPSHTTHAVDPFMLWYRPAAHAMHSWLVPLA